MNTARILIVDDDPGNADYVARILNNFQIYIYTDPEKALKQFQVGRYDLLISDQKMPGMTGINLISACKNISEDFQGIIISAYTDTDDLIDAVNSNTIHKYIIKPFTPDILLQYVHRAYESLCLLREKKELEQILLENNIRLNTENRRLKESNREYGLDRLSGFSPALLALKEQIETYANSDSTVLITGETGTGKELVAHAMHELSMRSTKPFIKINCTTLTPSLIESELFGHEKGAFTGAVKYKKGFFEAADGGTIFLDEIGDLSLEVQPKLLRILQFGSFYPVGGREEKFTNVRVIAATNISLEKSVKKGQFRGDLFHRLNLLRLRVPPLRERKEDIPEILYAINKKEFNNHDGMKLDSGALDLLMNHPYPGNIRELETYVHRLQLFFGNNDCINAKNVRSVLEPVEMDDIVDDSHEKNLKVDIEQMEKETITRAMEENNFNISRTAETLGISRQGLHNKLKRYNLQKR